MAFKTMLRQLISKWGIMSVEMQQAMEADVPVEEDYVQVENAEIPALETGDGEQQVSLDDV